VARARGRKRRRQAPEGALQKLLYTSTFHLVNVGDSYAVRQRKALEARIATRFAGGTRFVPVLSRKGGVGATTVTALMGMAFADVRDDRVIAIDANPDRGTLAERVTRTTHSSVRDVVTRSGSIASQAEFESLASRDETGLDVLASDGGPTQAEALGEDDYNVVADIAGRYDSIAVTDGGTGMLHPATRAALQRADAVVVVSGASVDEARSASDLLTWMESNGYADLAGNAVLALNTATVGTNLDKVEEIEAHFTARVREIVRIPYDPMLATGSVIHYSELKPFTRDAARDLAALVADGLAGGPPTEQSA
jgi:MinD-like ATPase involved in chromosome partitioning or flagellar assembly